MTFTRRFFTVAAGVALATSLALPVLAESVTQKLSSESVIETIKARGTIKIGLSLFVPWSMRDLNGDLVGFELDVGRKLAKDMGVEPEFIPTSWDGIIPALMSGGFDVIISGMSITPQRNLTVNFTDPYAYSGIQMLVNTKLTKGMKLEDFNSPDVTFAARRGGTPADSISQHFPKAKLLLFDEDGAATQEVLNGNATATMESQPSPAMDAARNPDVLSVPFEEVFDATGEAIALRKGDPDALNFFDNWIAMQWKLGFLKDRHHYWFETQDWADKVQQ